MNQFQCLFQHYRRVLYTAWFNVHGFTDTHPQTCDCCGFADDIHTTRKRANITNNSHFTSRGFGS